MGLSIWSAYEYISRARNAGILPGLDSNPYWMARNASRKQGVPMGSFQEILEGMKAPEYRWLARDVGHGESLADAARRAIQLAYDMVASDPAVKKGQARLRQMGVPGRDLSPTAGQLLERAETETGEEE